MTGQRFGRWLVFSKSSKRGKSGEVYWSCRCDCGNEKDVLAGPLKRGESKSCGCWNSEKSTKHGMENTRIYDVWVSMLGRCRNPNHKQWDDYGGRGIRVCERWQSFENFYADMGAKPKDLSLDRKDNDLGYSPENCRWATRKQQMDNRRVTPRFMINGEIKTLTELAQVTGIPKGRIYGRLRKGWVIEDAISILKTNCWHTRGKSGN